MKKLWFLASIIILSGCLTMRNYTKEEPRKDLSIEGNQGYLSGKAKESPKENRLGDTRTISVVDIEFGPRRIEKSKEEEPTIDAAGDQVLPLAKKNTKVSIKSKPIRKKEIQYYMVQENDTLQKISYKFYGTTRKWNFLYEINKDVLKSPDRLYLGVEIKIPPLEE